jgi:cytochrome b561
MELCMIVRRDCALVRYVHWVAEVTLSVFACVQAREFNRYAQSAEARSLFLRTHVSIGVALL